MKVELIEDKTSDEISQIWQEYHKHKDCIAGILTVEQYERIFELGGKYPTFLLPLPRERGYEFIMVQFHGSIIIDKLTSLFCLNQNQQQFARLTSYILF